ncbi:hypothetical protein D4764_11G0002780 [Takifugu flavidus]|uniref:Uncharacterized protein n=1 Tax=Takifugu flavidus TaxID=433684 RepID=A0A5C6PIF0_9TELE|nr:hypothetical protein D4764_11G0002780 [Takifugu flavidus]
MPKPPHLAPLNAEEQRLYSELLPDGRAFHPISKGEPSHPTEEAHFGRLYPRRMVVQNLFEAVRKSFSMASPNSSSPNSSHAWVVASATAVAALRLACQYLSAASGVPQASKGEPSHPREEAHFGRLYP